MTFDKVTEAMGECETVIRTYLTTSECTDTVRRQLEHCLDMIRRFREFTPDRLGKAFRWLGFIQGVMYAHGVADVTTLKNMNRPAERMKEQS